MKLDPETATEQELVTICRDAKLINIKNHGTRLVKLSKEFVIKFGTGVTPEEVSNQRYVYDYVNSNVLRVPKVHRFFQDTTLGPSLVMGYIVMEYINGTELDTYLLQNTLDEGEMAEVVERIVNALAHLSQIPLPIGQPPGPANGGKPSGYLWSDNGAGTSFNTVADMEYWLNQRLGLHKPGTCAKLDLKFSKLSMCHTDVAPRNILLLNGGGICFLDWAYAGFYPPLFEIYALQSRLNREPIFSRILEQLGPLTKKERDQLKYLALVENINLRYGEALNL